MHIEKVDGISLKVSTRSSEFRRKGALKARTFGTFQDPEQQKSRFMNLSKAQNPFIPGPAFIKLPFL